MLLFSLHIDAKLALFCTIRNEIVVLKKAIIAKKRPKQLPHALRDKPNDQLTMFYP